jgi:hypothetical protein
VAINDVYKLTTRMAYLGQNVQSTFHLRRKVAADPTSANALSIANAFKEQFRPQSSTSLAYTTWSLLQVVGGTVTYPQPL